MSDETVPIKRTWTAKDTPAVWKHCYRKGLHYKGITTSGFSYMKELPHTIWKDLRLKKPPEIVLQKNHSGKNSMLWKYYSGKDFATWKLQPGKDSIIWSNYMWKNTTIWKEVRVLSFCEIFSSINSFTSWSPFIMHNPFLFSYCMPWSPFL